MIKKIKCLLFGHHFDWAEYGERIEKEEHHADGEMVYCVRCKSYQKIKMRKIQRMINIYRLIVSIGSPLGIILFMYSNMHFELVGLIGLYFSISSIVLMLAFKENSIND